MTAPLILALAMLLDALFGEPRGLWQRLPHPAVLMGNTVAWADKRFNHGRARRLKGLLTLLGLAGIALVLGAALSWGGWIVETCVLAILLAQKSLVDHVADVARALRFSLAGARRAVARIVGRDTALMQPPALSRAAIESAAENLSDGVIAPAFWFLLGGLPGLLLYKITNTADSMIGYKNERYGDFGWASARFDDLLNVIPARLTALLIALSHGRLRDLPGIAAEAPKHRSPNAGWPEAAMARALGVALAGPRSYDGQLRDFPYVNAAGHKTIGAPEIEAACTALWRTWATAFALVLFMAVVFG